MQFALVKSQGIDDVVLSKHAKKSAAESAMKRLGGEPNSMFTNGMRIVELQHYDVIEVFGKKILRHKR